MEIKSINNGDHQARSPTLLSQLKEDPTKLKEVAKLYRTIVAIPDELALFCARFGRATV